MTFNGCSSIVNVNQTELRRQEKSTSKLNFCQVCGDKARYLYYGALVCQSCKTFFRRYSSYTRKTLRCQFDDNCKITIETRKVCSACRFSKCLTIGMNSDLIRKQDLSGMYISKHKAASILMISPSQLSTLDLLYNSRSSLLTSDWTLLSNVIHAFDHFIPITQTRQTIEHLSTSSSSLPLDMSQILSMFTNFYTSTESFISSSADFQVLTINEKSSLYQRNLHGVLHLCATCILYLSGMFDSSTNDQIIISIYGYDIFQQTKRIALQLDYDLAIIKLFLFILAFSSSCYMVNAHDNIPNDTFRYGTFRLFGSQNVYVEVLWKYMLYRYDYYQASIRFARLIKHMLDLLKISENVYQSNEVHQEFVDEIIVSTEQSLIINENEVVPLWGKTSTSKDN